MHHSRQSSKTIRLTLVGVEHPCCRVPRSFVVVAVAVVVVVVIVIVVMSCSVQVI